jgi:hypothetical protein
MSSLVDTVVWIKEIDRTDDRPTAEEPVVFPEIVVRL